MRVLLDKLIVSQRLKKFSAFYGILINYRALKSAPLDSVSSQINPAHSFQTYFFKIFFVHAYAFRVLSSLQVFRRKFNMYCSSFLRQAPPISLFWSSWQYQYPTIAQELNCRFSFSAARLRSQVRSYGICGGQSGTGSGLLWVLRSPASSHSASCFTFIITPSSYVVQYRYW
jgi:hypothetical protein